MTFFKGPNGAKVARKGKRFCRFHLPGFLSSSHLRSRICDKRPVPLEFSSVYRLTPSDHRRETSFLLEVACSRDRRRSPGDAVPHIVETHIDQFDLSQIPF